MIGFIVLLIIIAVLVGLSSGNKDRRNDELKDAIQKSNSSSSLSYEEFQKMREKASTYADYAAYLKSQGIDIFSDNKE